MSKLLYVLLAMALIATASAAPKEDASEEKAVAKKDTEEKTVSARDAVVAVVDDSWMSFFTNNSWTIGSAVLGVVFILGGVGLFSYYYYAVLSGDNIVGVPNSNAVYTTPGQPYAYNGYQTYAATGRAMDISGPNWGMNFVKVLDYIDIARKNYEGFDWQNLECQKRVLCELSQERSLTGETGRKMANNYLLRFVDVLDGLPIPQVIQAYLTEYKEAVSEGKNSKKTCSEIYGKCKFSLIKLVENIKNKKE